MFGLAYVILPFSDKLPGAAITSSLARFQGGGKGDLPAEWLRFHDRTAEMTTLHDADLTCIKDVGLRTEGTESWLLDTNAILREMERRAVERWPVRFADIERDVVQFAANYLRPLDRHPVTGGFGRWLNDLGQWDWWDLGGCFDGVITGDPRKSGRGYARISSGPCIGRTALDTLAGALGEALDKEPDPEIDIETDRNIEIVSRLRDDLLAKTEVRLPGALVLPPASLPDSMRWIMTWFEGPPRPDEARDWLGLPAGSNWRTVVTAVYDRFPDHWARA